MSPYARTLAAFALAPMLALLATTAGAEETAPKPAPCGIGAYRLAGGDEVVVQPSAGASLRWRRFDGTSGALTEGAGGVWTSTLGWTKKPDGKTISFDCAKGAIAFDGVEGRRIDFDVAETRFDSAGAALAGRLVMPKGSGAAPIVVLLHGSERDSAMRFNALQRLLPARGVGVFVYDKRGTGASSGSYTQDFSILADDAVAAMREARRLAGARAGRIGYQGPSQGGWVAPLAASRAPVDFVVVGFGLAVSPLEEDRSAIVLDMERRGYGPDVMAKAMELADASAALVTSDFKTDFKASFDRFDAVRTKYRGEPWFKHVRGNFTFMLLNADAQQIREAAAQYVVDTPWRYDPMPVLRTLKTPELWMLGADDLAAPSAETIRRLKELAAQGRPITTAVFPRADHGVYEYETTAAGERLSTRNPEGYFRMMADYIRDGRLSGAYGASTITAPAVKAARGG
ncbi:alpha/beta hydrolase [Caulobacter sp. CCUG 60055]|nr:alpha/beta hydrolase [Caulobacter sp. CCUG 60055]MBQ1541826.1 alpha/beta hydrolase [Caulobacteraceae bacterium]